MRIEGRGQIEASAATTARMFVETNDVAAQLDDAGDKAPNRRILVLRSGLVMRFEPLPRHANDWAQLLGVFTAEAVAALPAAPAGVVGGMGPVASEECGACGVKQGQRHGNFCPETIAAGGAIR